MRLPDDYEDHGGGLTPTVISAIVAVTIFVAVILTVVLIMNRQPTSHQQNNTAAQTENVQQEMCIRDSIYASVSGTVKTIETRRVVTGDLIQSIVIDNDGLYESEEFHPYAPVEDVYKRQFLWRGMCRP